MKFHVRALFGAAIALAICIAAGLLLSRFVSHAGRWNLLLVTLDTTRADRLGCYGYAYARTPALDRLAAEGTVFENARCNVPLTLPSHASIMTGLLPPEHGLRVNASGKLPRHIPTLAELMAARGYKTAAFVASPVVDSKFGLDRGFQVYDDEMPPAAIVGDIENNPYRSGDSVADAAVAWLRKQGQGGFMCWVHLYDPHAPYSAHENLFGSIFTNRPYDAEIAFADMQIARLMACLDEIGVKDKTLVVVIGDHGESLGGPHAEPLPYHGFMLYDQTMHIPMIFTAPGGLGQGVRVPSSVSAIDLFPTVLSLMGLKAPTVSGRDLSGAFRGVTIRDGACYGETEFPASYSWGAQQCIVSGSWKYIRSPKPELVNLAVDPVETNNLAAVESDMAGDMEKKLSDIEAGMTVAAAEQVALSPAERRRIMSLGYVASGSSGASRSGAKKDIKDMLSVLRQTDMASDLMKQGRAAEAVEQWRAAVAAAPETVGFRNSLGCALMEDDKTSEALAEFEQAQMTMERETIRKETAYWAIVNNRAFALAKLERYREALPFALQAVESDVLNGEFNHTLAYVYRGLGRTQEAGKYASMAVSLAPADMEARMLFAEILMDRGDIERAVSTVKPALQMKIGDKWKRAALEFLEKAGTIERPGDTNTDEY